MRCSEQRCRARWDPRFESISLQRRVLAKSRRAGLARHSHAENLDRSLPCQFLRVVDLTQDSTVYADFCVELVAKHLG